MNEQTENRASRVLAHYELLVSQRRFDEAVALYADDMAATDLRSGVSAPPLGSADLEKASRITFELYDFFDSLNIAVRGERLVLSRIATRTTMRSRSSRPGTSHWERHDTNLAHLHKRERAQSACDNCAIQGRRPTGPWIRRVGRLRGRRARRRGVDREHWPTASSLSRPSVRLGTGM